MHVDYHLGKSQSTSSVVALAAVTWIACLGACVSEKNIKYICTGSIPSKHSFSLRKLKSTYVLMPQWCLFSYMYHQGQVFFLHNTAILIH